MNQYLPRRMLHKTPASVFPGFHIKKVQPRNLSFLLNPSLKVLSLVLISFIFILNPLQGQTKEENNNQKTHSPKRASLYSAVLPGLGQAYNRKYWKMPIIYAGFGTLYFITKDNTREYKKFLEAYRYVVNKDTVPISNEYINRYNEPQLLQGKNLYRRNVEIGYILAGALYILNIIDASVDAHLFDYDVSDNLSLRLEPVLLRDPVAAQHVTGMALTIRF